MFKLVHLFDFYIYKVFQFFLKQLNYTDLTYKSNPSQSFEITNGYLIFLFHVNFEMNLEMHEPALDKHQCQNYIEFKSTYFMGQTY